MDVHDVAFERAQKIAFEHAHETGEHDKIHFRILQSGDESTLGIFIQLGAEFSRRDELGRQLAFARVGEKAGVLDIAKHKRDLRRNLSFGDGVGDGHEIGAFAGTENADAKCVTAAHAV